MRRWLIALALLIALAQVVVAVDVSAQSAPSLTVQPSVASPGSSLQVTGTGFPSTAGTAQVCIDSIAGSCKNAPISAGLFTVSLYVPPSTAAGTYTVSATPANGAAVKSTFQVSVYTPPTGQPVLTYGITASPETVMPGQQVTVRGVNWPIGVEARVCLVTNDLVPPCVLAGSGVGELVATLTVPYGTPPGSYRVTAFPDKTTFGAAITTIHVGGAAAEVLLDPTSVAPGGSSRVLAYGLEALGGAVTVTATSPAGQQVGTASAPVMGDGSANLTLPIAANSAPGQYTVQLTQAGAVAGAATVQVVAGSGATSLPTVAAGSTDVDITPSTVAPGGTALILGSGFESGEGVQVGFSYGQSGGSISQQMTGSASFNGSFVIRLPVAAGVPAGTYTLTATGLSSGRSATDQLTVSTQPFLVMSPLAADPGSTIRITGQRFIPNAAVTVTAQVPLAGGGTATVPSTDASATYTGVFGAQIVIPPNAAAGPVTVTATQVGSGASGTLLVTTPDPTLDLRSSAAVPGATITASLAGFSGGDVPITVSAQFRTSSGSPEAVMQNVDPGADGTASMALTIPVTAVAGPVTVDATQPGTGAETSQTLQIIGGAPPATPTTRATAGTTVIATSTPLATPGGTVAPVLRMKFKRASLWYQTVRVGTFNHVSLQANQGGRIDVRVVVTFPSGATLTYHGRTHGKGVWNRTFPVPVGALTGSSETATVRIRLQKGVRGVSRTLSFTVVP